MRIHLLGGVDTVTGSQHLLETNGIRVLRDCGLFQGHRKEAREINGKFPFNPEILDCVVLSHAHIDHCGNIPNLIKGRFSRPIHATDATASLAAIMLRDSAHIQEQDAAYLNQKTNRRGFQAVVPLYTVKEAEQSLLLFNAQPYGADVPLAEGLSVRFHEAGHILGAALTSFTARENGRTIRVGFALDLGRDGMPMIRDPEVMTGLDVLVIESTYGDRVHTDAGDGDKELLEVVLKTWKRGGKVIIPSFALERAQQIIFHLGRLISSGQLPRIPVFVDSPMAAAVSTVFENHPECLDEEFVKLETKLGHVMRPEWLRYVSTPEESKKVTASDAPCVVISASGMCEHGRILHHLKHGIENPLNMIAIVGFQAAHTLGRRIAEGEKKVRIFGDWFERKAEVAVLHAFSAHADKNELVDYVLKAAPGRTYLVHGEQDQREALAKSLRENGVNNVFVPAKGDVIDV